MTENIVKIKKRKKKTKFWRGFAIYAGVLVVLVGALCIYTWNTMKDYEKSQPELIIENIIAELEKGDISSVEGAATSKFEAADVMSEQFKTLIDGAKLDYSRASLTADKAVYTIIKDKTKVAEVTVKASNTKNVLTILSISDWELESVAMTGVAGTNDVKITAPSTYTVMVNGVTLGDDEKLEGEAQAEGLKYAAEYVEVPSIVTYQVKGLFNAPVVTATDGDGNEVEIASDTDTISIGFIAQEIPEDIREFVVNAAMDYSNFFSRDLAGCSESTACIQKYFPTDSYYITLAEQYRREDMWMYSSHNTPVFKNITVTDYIEYTDSLFSVTVAFEKEMVLTSTGNTNTDVNNQTYYYVKIDGNWVIADIQDNG